MTIKNQFGKKTYTFRKDSIAYMYNEYIANVSRNNINTRTDYYIVLKGNDEDSNTVLVDKDTYEQVKEWLENDK